METKQVGRGIIKICIVMLLSYAIIRGIEIRQQNYLYNPYGLEAVNTDIASYKTGKSYNEEYPWEFMTIVQPYYHHEINIKDRYIEKLLHEISGINTLDKDIYLKITPYKSNNYSDFSFQYYLSEESYNTPNKTWVHEGKDAIFIEKKLDHLLDEIIDVEVRDTEVRMQKYFQVTYVLDHEYGYWVPCYVNQSIRYNTFLWVHVTGENYVSNMDNPKYRIKVISNQGEHRIFFYSLDYQIVPEQQTIPANRNTMTLEPTVRQKEMAKIAFAEYRGGEQIWDAPPTTSFYEYETGRKIATIKWDDVVFPIIKDEENISLENYEKLLKTKAPQDHTELFWQYRWSR